MKFYRNKKGGSGTVELAPALLVIFVIILIPMLDLLYLGLAYACGWYCNHLVVREVACTDPKLDTRAIGSATAAWSASGLAKFIGASGATSTAKFFPGKGPTPPPQTVTVTTSVTVNPFLPIPFMMSVNGLNAPITFTYGAERPQEEKGIK